MLVLVLVTRLSVTRRSGRTGATHTGTAVPVPVAYGQRQGHGQGHGDGQGQGHGQGHGS